MCGVDEAGWESGDGLTSCGALGRDGETGGVA